MRCNKRIYKGHPGSQIDLIFVKNVLLAFQPFKRVLNLKFSKVSDVGVTPPEKLVPKIRTFLCKIFMSHFFVFF